jgi:hypothetical protein
MVSIETRSVIDRGGATAGRSVGLASGLSDQCASPAGPPEATALAASRPSVICLAIVSDVWKWRGLRWAITEQRHHGLAIAVLNNVAATGLFSRVIHHRNHGSHCPRARFRAAPSRLGRMIIFNSILGWCRPRGRSSYQDHFRTINVTVLGKSWASCRPPKSRQAYAMRDIPCSGKRCPDNPGRHRGFRHECGVVPPNGFSRASVLFQVPSVEPLDS